METLHNAIQNMNTRYYIKTLFDYVQTHAVYGVDVNDVVAVKTALKACKATRFRVVKATANLRIVCFKQPK